MEIIVFLLSVVNILLAFFVLFGGRYILKRLDQVEEAVHQLEVRTMGGHTDSGTPAQGKTISDTGWE
ncbi:MAG: hypothetical protein RIE53_06655 [Rhodothermales bacterium]